MQNKPYKKILTKSLTALIFCLGSFSPLFLNGQGENTLLLANADLDELLFQEEAFPFHDFLNTDNFDAFEIEPLNPSELEAALEQEEIAEVVPTEPKPASLERVNTKWAKEEIKVKTSQIPWSKTTKVQKESEVLPLEVFQKDKKIVPDKDWVPQLAKKQVGNFNRASDESPFLEIIEEKPKETVTSTLKICKPIEKIEPSFKNRAAEEALQNLLVLKAHTVWNKSLYEAFSFLSEAYKINSKNPWVLYQRGFLFEDLCRPLEALQSFEKAVAYANNNLFYLDALFQFQIKAGHFKEALESLVLLEAKDPAVEFKEDLLFWEKVVLPVDKEKSFSCFRYKSNPYIAYLASIDGNQFWDQGRVDAYHLEPLFLEESKSVFWLKTLDLLQREKEKEALSFLEKKSIAFEGAEKQMLESLKYLLRYRLGASKKDLSEVDGLASLGAFKSYLENGAYSLNVKNEFLKTSSVFDCLMRDKAAFLYFFSLYEWSNAALLLYPIEKLSKNIPDFIKVEIIKEIYEIKGPLEAIGYAAVQPKSPAITLSLGELFLALGQENMGIQTLTEIEESATKEGEKASMLVAFYWMEKKGYQEVIKTVMKNSLLKASMKGKELLAKAYLELGNREKTEEIYKEIEKNSSLAKSYFAIKAFREGNLKTAKALTEELLDIYPDSLTLQENLEKIFLEENKE